MLAFPFPYIANTAGWMTAELGRQPWLVYGLMRTVRRREPDGALGHGALHADWILRPLSRARPAFLFLSDARSRTDPSHGLSSTLSIECAPVDAACRTLEPFEPILKRVLTMIEFWFGVAA